MKLAFLSLLSRNGIVDFIRNNKSQHIKILLQFGCCLSFVPSVAFLLLVAQGVALLRLTYHTALITRVVIIIRLL